MKNLKHLIIVLILLLQGCRSTEIIYKTKTRIPELDPPVFPLADLMKNNADGTVTVDSEWIVNIEKFRIEYERLCKDYQDIKNIYEDKE